MALALVARAIWFFTAPATATIGGSQIEPHAIDNGIRFSTTFTPAVNLLHVDTGAETDLASTMGRQRIRTCAGSKCTCNDEFADDLHLN